MIFIWGKKHVRRSIGYVADFCPICRDLRTFQVKRIGLASHIYYLSFGEGALVGHVRTCDVCGVDLNAKPEVYKSLHRTKLPPAELAAITRPEWREVYAQRLAIERELSNAFAKVPPDLRKVLVREPFDLVALRVEERFAKSELDWQTGLAYLGLIPLVIIAMKLAERFTGAADAIYLTAAVLGLAAVGSQVFLIKRRWFRKRIFPMLALALRPIKPTHAELKATLDAMKAEGRAIGKKLDVNSLVAELQRTASVGTAGLADAGDLRATGGT